MAGKAQARFMQRTFARQIDRSNAYIRGKSEYGVTCIYCEEYFPNVRKGDYGYVCKQCRS